MQVDLAKLNGSGVGLVRVFGFFVVGYFLVVEHGELGVVDDDFVVEAVVTPHGCEEVLNGEAVELELQVKLGAESRLGERSEGGELE
jgi:hypothetical protein